MRRREFVRLSAAASAALAAGDTSALAAQSGGELRRAPQSVSSAARADLVLRNATIYDGTGALPFTGDVAITGGRIADVAARISATGSEELDLRGLALAPGFIDPHSHTGAGLASDPSAASKVRQGVTTEVTGQDGSSILRDAGAAPFHDTTTFLAWMDANGAAVNMASMVGTGTLRGHVVGDDDRRATSDEIARMTQLVRDALRGGACGVSSGLEYTPGGYADVAELEQVVAPLRGTRLPFSSHMRNEDDRLTAAVEEILGIGQRANVAVHISHLKAQGERNWWKTDTVLGMIGDARAAGIDATFDVYPYIAYATGITNLFPIWSRDGGTDAFLARLDDAAEAARIEQAVRDKIALLGTWDAVQFTSAGNAQYEYIVAQRLGTLATQRGVEPYALLLDIVRGTRGRPQMVGFGMKEELVARKLAHPAAMVCSDAGAAAFNVGAPHPRAYGSYPRVLGRFVRELKALTLESAVHRMTMMPAQRFGFADRGKVAVGLVADLTAFDPATVIDRATFEQPHQYPVGIPHVIVNGVFVVRDGSQTAATPGRAVRPSGS